MAQQPVKYIHRCSFYLCHGTWWPYCTSVLPARQLVEARTLADALKDQRV